ncbi:hypothetical protein ACHAXT_006145 [Thalassiosira profunda]
MSLGSPTIAILPPLPEGQPPGSADSGGGPSAPPAPSSPHAADAPIPVPEFSSPRVASNWDADSTSNHCSACQVPFDPLFQRRHHCRLCGRLFCHECSNTRSLVPPSALVLKANGQNRSVGPSFAPSNDGDASVTYVGASGSSLGEIGDDTLLYGKGLEQRMLLARQPQRTCHACRQQLAPLQEELRLRNSNAMRYNYIDEGDDVRRLCNSPLAFTLGHEVRKAAYALGNLLPGNKAKRGGFVATSADRLQYSYPPPEADPCHIPSGAACKTIDPTLKNLDKMQIPAKLLQRARGVAIVTAAKGGLGFAGFEFGTGLVVARRHPNDEDGDPDDWSAPSAIGLAGVAWGALIGAQISDHVFLLMTDDAVRLFSSENGKSIQLGADVGVALGPLGRSAEADFGATSSTSRNLDDERVDGGLNPRGSVAMAPIYTYSLAKGLYAGVSLDGRVLSTRERVNEKFYGQAVSAHELLSGKVPSPPAAQPLYDALKRCRIYGGGGDHPRGGSEEADFLTLRDDYSVNRGGSQGSGRLMERISYSTGAGLPTRPAGSKYSSPNPYNLSPRGGN